mmetsp:Transcript_78508/g.156037  ORF Transcript_78508/g.156037 Transcript_78508/m.156037 type:complete len:218 (-) Transcript_78508:133-786(-)
MQANLELHTRVPFLLRVPWMPKAMAQRSSTSLVELVDIYPTLLDLAGVTLSGEALEGTSLMPLLEGKPWNKVAFSQYPRCLNTSKSHEPPYLGTRDPCIGVPAREFTHMGYTMRTADWRYTEWPRWKGILEPDWTKVDGVELYAHKGDDGTCFDCFENVNVATDPQHAELIKELSTRLRTGPASGHEREILLPYREDANIFPLGEVEGEGELPAPVP